MSDLSNQYIDDTFPGVLHASGATFPLTGQVDIYDGVGVKSSLKLGKACEGATVCGTLTVDDLVVGGVSFLDKIYPVGSAYFSTNIINPSTLFGGTWVQIASGKFLAGVGTGTDKNAASHTVSPGDGDATGEYSHILSVAELATHLHTPLYTYVSEDDNPDFSSPAGSVIGNDIGGSMVEHSGSYTANAGNSLPHNNVPPTFGLYVFQRTA